MKRVNAKTIQLLGIIAVLWSTSAVAKIPLCVRVQGFESQSMEDYHRAVENEIRRHPNHTPVDSNCERTLNVEYLGLKPNAVVTGYLDGQVPSRVTISKENELNDAVSKLISQVLKSDPAAWIRNPKNYLDQVLISDAGLKRGVLLFGVEAFQHLTRTGEGPSFLPGIAVRMRRGLGPVHVGARLAAAFMPRTLTEGSKPQMSLLASLEPEVAWFATNNSDSSFYLAGSLGLTVIRMDGYADGKESLHDVGVSLGVRAGLELLRISDYRVDLFVQGHLPLFMTNGTESDIVDAYTPGIQIGAGIAF